MILQSMRTCHCFCRKGRGLHIPRGTYSLSAQCRTLLGSPRSSVATRGGSVDTQRTQGASAAWTHMAPHNAVCVGVRTVSCPVIQSLGGGQVNRGLHEGVRDLHVPLPLRGVLWRQVSPELTCMVPPQWSGLSIQPCCGHTRSSQSRQCPCLGRLRWGSALWSEEQR